MSVDVFFDYTCGYSDRARHWLDALEDVDLVWRPFSLLEQNARDGGTAVFERDQYADNPSLMALAVHEQVRAQDGDVNAYRRRMFTAWHEGPCRLSTDDIVGFGRDAGLRDFDRAARFAAVASEHAAAAEPGAFGTRRSWLRPVRPCSPNWTRSPTRNGRGRCGRRSWASPPAGRTCASGSG